MLFIFFLVVFRIKIYIFVRKMILFRVFNIMVIFKLKLELCYIRLREILKNSKKVVG